MKNINKPQNKYYCNGIYMLLIAMAFLWTSPHLHAQSQHVTPDGKGNLTFIPGVRMQVRYENNQIDKNNDFYIKRMRFKGKGSIYGIASYNFELKVDGTGQFNKAPVMQLEHAWFTFPLVENNLTLRVGLEDDVYSRNALTSDSKLLLMDRSQIKEALTRLGITDNTIGALIYGRPMDGRITYSAGVFDNLGFNFANNPDAALARKSDGAMWVGRIAYDFFELANPAGSYDDYRSSYLDGKTRLTLGTNVAHLSQAEIGDEIFSVSAYGADLFFGVGPMSFEAEYDKYSEKLSSNGQGTIDGDGWYVQGGVLVTPKLELALRYQTLDQMSDEHPESIGDKIDWTSIGANYYFKGHDFKIQAEYTIKNEESISIDNNVFVVQLQLSF
ncbi:MAG: hypothetical protein KDD01_21385 [Phaeodactylibacter sp.]|nr:hypothetical protein [Phaeodactylibacter sp.]